MTPRTAAARKSDAREGRETGTPASAPGTVAPAPVPAAAAASVPAQAAAAPAVSRRAAPGQMSVAIVGAGRLGSALALALGQNGYRV
ncbi:MAG TPA: hypothetical protein VGB61_07650, partial [Pyrinomonadaceae bacterium]